MNQRYNDLNQRQYLLARSVARGRQKWHDKIADWCGNAVQSTAPLHDPIPAVPFERTSS